MIGSQVERQGIIRHGAKMITAVAEATVPKFSVIVRKAYGAGLYAMCGPAFDPDACLALPTAQIAVMGPDPAVNAVFYNRIHAIEDPDERAAFVAEQRARVRGGRRPRAPRGRARRRRGGAARGSARRAGPAARPWPPAGSATTPTSATASRRSRPVHSSRSRRAVAQFGSARLTGGQEVPGSNPGSPTHKARSEGLLCSLELSPKALPKNWNVGAARSWRSWPSVSMSSGGRNGVVPRAVLVRSV